MYTIAFDETTNFETLKTGTQKKEPVMLAGIIYNDNSEIVYKKGGKIIDPERERIILYYKAVCKSAGTTLIFFPPSKVTIVPFLPSLVFKRTLETLAIDGRASPLKPRDSI